MWKDMWKVLDVLCGIAYLILGLLCFSGTKWGMLITNEVMARPNLIVGWLCFLVARINVEGEKRNV